MNDTLTQDGKSITLNDAQMAIYKKDLNSKIGWGAVLLGGTFAYYMYKDLPEKEGFKLITVTFIIGAAFMYANKTGIRKGLFLADVK